MIVRVLSLFLSFFLMFFLLHALLYILFKMNDWLPFRDFEDSIVLLGIAFLRARMTFHGNPRTVNLSMIIFVSAFFNTLSKL